MGRFFRRSACQIVACLCIGTTSAWSQVYSDLETPQEMPSDWQGYYAKNLAACRDDSYIEGVTIERKGLHFYEAAALALRIVWVNDNEELYMYGVLGGEGTAGPSSYRIKMSPDKRSIDFFGGQSADDENSIGEHLIKCP